MTNYHTTQNFTRKPEPTRHSSAGSNARLLPHMIVAFGTDETATEEALGLQIAAYKAIVLIAHLLSLEWTNGLSRVFSSNSNKTGTTRLKESS